MRTFEIGDRIKWVPSRTHPGYGAQGVIKSSVGENIFVVDMDTPSECSIRTTSDFWGSYKGLHVFGYHLVPGDPISVDYSPEQSGDTEEDI